MLLPEDKALQSLVEARIPRWRDIRLGRLTPEHRLLRLPHGLQDGRFPLIVTVYPHAEIDLVRVPVRAERGHEAEDRIGGKSI
jgi:hypothetical protein